MTIEPDDIPSWEIKYSLGLIARTYRIRVIVTRMHYS